MFYTLISQMNPSATEKADVGFQKAEKMGTVRHVNLSDIKSGKVKLPGSGPTDDGYAGEAAENEIKSKKGFGR